MSEIDFKLYLITDRNQTAGRPLPEIIREAGEAGVQAVQFREKDLSLREQLALADTIHTIAKQYAMKLFINDRVDLCLAIDADGVHLPASGLPVHLVRKLLGTRKQIGVSCHALKDVLQAEAEGADFVVLGPIYDTPSKRAYGPPLGIDYLRQVQQAVRVPVFAIGGIGEEKLSELFEAGADGVAMVSYIMGAPNVRERCRAVLDIMKCRQDRRKKTG